MEAGVLLNLVTYVYCIKFLRDLKFADFVVNLLSAKSKSLKRAATRGNNEFLTSCDKQKLNHKKP